MRLAALEDGVGAGEIEDRRPGLALQRDQGTLVLSKGKARRPQERSDCP